MAIIAIILIFLQIYVYFLYPIILLGVARYCTKVEDLSQFDFFPMVTLIIAARNEEKVIETKIKNSLKLTYPKEKLEILVVSDHSQDKTEEIVREYENRGVSLMALECRHGKTKLQNVAVEQAKGDIIVFSDANAMYVPDAIQHLVKHFSDPAVGCVSGELCYANPEKSAAGKEENLYWKYEKFIKRQEDRVLTILGANGSIYAVRKSDYVPLENDIISDFIEPLEVAYRGKKVKFDEQAVSFEEVSMSFEEELKRKRRILSRSIYSLFIHRHLLNPRKNIRLSWGLMSHKVLRWISPLLLFILFLINLLLLQDRLFHCLFMMQILFYSLGLLGYWLNRYSKIPTIILAPYYFCLLGYASLLGIYDFITGKNRVIWEPIRN